MTGPHPQPYAAFRLNLEQQHKRAKDLLKAAKAGEPDALRRLRSASFGAPGEHITKLRGSKLWQVALLEAWLQTNNIGGTA